MGEVLSARARRAKSPEQPVAFFPLRRRHTIKSQEGDRRSLPLHRATLINQSQPWLNTTGEEEDTLKPWGAMQSSGASLKRHKLEAAALGCGLSG